MVAHRARAFGSVVIGVALAGALAACTSTHKPAALPEDVAPAASGETEPTSPPKENLPPGTISRTQLDQALLRGPAFLLSRVQLEEVLRQNKFVGWRLISFPADWDGSGLQPGDVVTQVNGSLIERPDDMWVAWLAASDAQEIKIGFERNGQPSTTVVKVQGAPRPETRKALEAGAMNPGPASPGEVRPRARTATEATTKKRFDTKVIGGESGEPAETSDY